MRDYAKISPQFWIGETGRKLRGDPEAQVLAAYLMSCPHANMIGMYYLPLAFISHETGMTAEGASKALQRLSEAGFCAYDLDVEVIWIFEMAKFQIAERLKATDNLCKGVLREVKSVPQNKHLDAFFERYDEAFHLREVEENDGKTEAPSKPLRSQEQEQEQERSKPPRAKRIIKTTIPADFGISDPVRKWAKAKGLEPWLEANLEFFRDYAESNGKKYADWDKAFRNCIRGDWGSTRRNGKQPPNGPRKLAL